MIRATGRRVSHADTGDLALLCELRDDLEDAIAVAARGLHAEGYSWQAIGDALGVTRQAALMRWGDAATSRQAPKETT